MSVINTSVRQLNVLLMVQTESLECCQFCSHAFWVVLLGPSSLTCMSGYDYAELQELARYHCHFGYG